MTTARPYHHGDLRRTLLAAADDEIRAAGVAQLSLRQLARRAGVSHAAPAHHFGDKSGLITALAADGFRMLHEGTSLVLGRPDALVRAGERYVAFALDHPSHFAVMFETTLLDATDENLARERDRAFEVFFQAVEETTGAADDAATLERAIAAWAVVHGFATLWLAGNLPLPCDSSHVAEAFATFGDALRVVAATSAPYLPKR